MVVAPQGVIPGGRRQVIRTKNSLGVASTPAARSTQPFIIKQTRTSKKKSGISLPKVALYSGAFVLFVAVVAAGYQQPQSVQNRVAAVQNVDGSDAPATDTSAPAVDKIIATNVAAGITEQANLPIASNVANMAVSLSAKSELAQTDDTVISKPQIIQPGSTNRTVTYYTAKKGDTVDTVAEKYGLSSDTISWANDLSFDSIAKGKKLVIPPVDGILYDYKKGDSIADIAGRYHTSKERIISYNDLELAKPKSGQHLILPGGVLPTSQRPGYVKPAPTPSYSTTDNGVGLGGTVVDTGMARASAGNRYAPGNCTWYAYERRAQLGSPVGSFWGNANTWAMNARAAGYSVNSKPGAGAVLVDQSGYYGHVAIVENVKRNGDIVVSEMNNFAYGGFNIVDKRVISAGQAAAYVYIH